MKGTVESSAGKSESGMVEAGSAAGTGKSPWSFSTENDDVCRLGRLIPGTGYVSGPLGP